MPAWVDAEIATGLVVRLVASAEGLRAIYFDTAIETQSPADCRPNPHLDEATRQLRSYFEGGLRVFRLTLDMQGTEFQKRVWRELLTVPYGETRSYSQIALAIGSPRAVRAVGAANGANPVPIVVPCHRVIGASGRLTGYGGGLPLKQRLLELERPKASGLLWRDGEFTPV